MGIKESLRNTGSTGINVHANGSSNGEVKGRISLVVLPMLRVGIPVADITDATGLTPAQVRNARGHGRDRGYLPHPTTEETREARSISHLGQACPFRGRTHSFDSLRKMSEFRRGHPLSEIEREQLMLAAEARQVPHERGIPTLDELYASWKRIPPARGKNKTFLDIFYGAVTSVTVEPVNSTFVHAVALCDMKRVYELLDPDVFRRMRSEVSFILDKSPARFEKDLEVLIDERIVKNLAREDVLNGNSLDIFRRFPQFAPYLLALGKIVTKRGENGRELACMNKTSYLQTQYGFLILQQAE